MSTLLSFDFGLARIGVAVGETETGNAHPLAVIADEANAARFAAIEKLLAEWKPSALVVGLPTLFVEQEFVFLQAFQLLPLTVRFRDSIWVNKHPYVGHRDVPISTRFPLPDTSWHVRENRHEN